MSDLGKIIFCRVSWKKEYKMEPRAWRGGKYVETHGEGGERHNFLPFKGYYYGYFQPPGGGAKKGAKINVKIKKQLGATGEKIDGINVIWVATPPQGKGTKIVGVYKNATLYEMTKELAGDDERKVNHYRVKAKVSDSFLIPENKRNIDISKNIPHFRGYYSKFDSKDNSKFAKKLKRLLKTGKNKYAKIEKEAKEEAERCKYGKGGESSAHKKLKKEAGENPDWFGASKNAEYEYPLPSGDKLDVLFRDGDKWIAVEVKSIHSNYADLERGIFQLVKYHAVLQHMIKTKNYGLKESEVFLLIQKNSELPKRVLKQIKKLAKKLGLDKQIRIYNKGKKPHFMPV